MKRDEIVKEIIKYFEDNDKLFTACIEDLDSYNGYLGDDRFYYMDEIDEIYSDPLEALRRAYYGHDGEVYETDERGEKHYAPFCPNREYFTFNGYGNFVSYDEKDYSDHLDEYAVDAMQENRREIYGINDDETLRGLFDQLDEIDASDDEQE